MNSFYFSQDFVRATSNMGPKQLLESCMRHYTVLSKSERILLRHGDQNFCITVLELRPSNPISLLGDLDLQVKVD